MNIRDSGVDVNRIREISASGSDRQRRQLAGELASEFDEHRGLLEQTLDDPLVRRWCRGVLLEHLADGDAAGLAERLLDWPEDFRPERRDRTTLNVVAVLPEDTLRSRLLDLAGGNASSVAWARLAGKFPDEVFTLAREVLNAGERFARETTLHLLVLDPYGPEYLNRDRQNELLMLALEDPDDEIRGLAAEVLAVDLPERLLQRSDIAPFDASERVRMAFWRTGFVHEPDHAREASGNLVLDRFNPLSVRRTALLALGEHLPTRDVSPILEAILSGDEQVLAEDAADLMWRHHRTPAVANAAASSPFESVRELAERLLHAERGSPAAGGSRPGDPTRTSDFYDGILSWSDEEDRERGDR